MSATSIGALELEIKAKAAHFNRALEMAEKRLEHITDVAEKVGKVATIAFGAGAIGIGVAIKKASDYHEALNVLEVAFGRQADAVRSWAETTSREVGRSQALMVDLAGTIGVVLPTALGSARVEISKTLAELSVDFGSVFNMDDREVAERFRAGLMGSSEAMDRLGVNARDANLEVIALRYGIKQSTATLSQEQKTILRYAAILESAFDGKVGDARKTLHGFANATKAVSGAIDGLIIDLGGQLLPAAEGLTAALAGLLSVFRDLPEPVKKGAAVFGVALTALAGLAAAASGVALVMGPLAAAFGTLLGPITVAAVAVAGLGAAYYALREALVESMADFEAWGIKASGWIKSVESAALSLIGIIPGIGAVANLAKGAIEVSNVSGAGAGAEDGGSSFDNWLADAKKKLNDQLKDLFAGFDKLKGPGKAAEDLVVDFDALGDAATDGLASAFEKLSEDLNNMGAFEFDELGSVAVTGLADAMQDLSAEVNDTVFDFDELGSVAVTGLAEAMQKLSAEVNSARAFENAGVQIGEAATSIASDLGTAGDILNGFTQGLAQGGPIGAILGVIMAVIQQLEGFGQIMDIMSDDLSILFDGLNEFLVPLVEASQRGSEALRQGFEGLGDIMAQFGEIVSLVGDILAPIHEISGPALQIVFQALASVVRVVVLAFQWLKNAFLDIAIEFMKFIGNFTNTSQAIEDLQNAKEDMSKEAIEKGFADIWKDTGKDIKTKKEIEEGAKAFQRQIAEQAAAAKKAAEKATKSKKLEDLQALVDEIFGKGVANAAKLSDEQQYVVDQVMGKRTADLNQSWDNKWGHLWGKGATALEDFTKKLHDATGALTNVPSGFRVDRLRYNSIDVTGATNPGASAAGGSTFVINGVTLNVKDMDDFLRQLQAQQMQQNAAQRGNPMLGPGSALRPL